MLAHTKCQSCTSNVAKGLVPAASLLELGPGQTNRLTNQQEGCWHCRGIGEWVGQDGYPQPWGIG